MSGLFGFVDPGQHLNAGVAGEAIAARLRHLPWHRTQVHFEPGVNASLGHHGIGHFNDACQPLWDAARCRAVFLCGEIYGAEGCEWPVEAREDAQRMLDLYERHGRGFARRLDGAFLIAILDLEIRQLVIANDRFGLYPLFYARPPGGLLFAPEMKGILSLLQPTPRLDLTAVAQYLRFQQLLGDRTFFEGVKLLPPAVTLVCDLETAQIDLQPYWSFAEIPFRPDLCLPEAAEEAGHLLRRSVTRLARGPYPVGAFLSGGLDSRAIVGLLPERGAPTFTFGHPEARDVVYAARIARMAGTRHHWFDLSEGGWVLDHLDLHLQLTEGLHSWIHMHGMSVLAEARSCMAVNLTGWDGGEVMGTHDVRDLVQAQAVDKPALVSDLFECFNQRYTWPGLTEAEERLLYHDSVRARMSGLAFDSFREELAPFLDYRPDMRADFFFLHTQCRRMTANMVTLYRSHFETRFPYFDQALTDFTYSLPATLRGYKALHRAVIARELPRLALIPYDHDETLPTANTWIRATHGFGVKALRRLRRLSGLFGHGRPTLYADYERYLREELRPWAESVLFDGRLAGRGLFDPAFVRTLFERHLSGRELWTIGKLAPIMSLELMLRHLVDEPNERALNDSPNETHLAALRP